MKTLFFPDSDYPLIAFILALPLLGAFVNGVFGRRLGKSAVRMMALAVMGLAFAAAIATFADLNHLTDALKAGAKGGEGEAHAKLSWLAWEWMKASGPLGSRITIDLRFSVDALSGVMMLVVT